MRLSRIIMALTVGLAVAAVPTAAGAAQPQPPVYPPVVTCTVEPPTITLGETFTLHCTGFVPGETVTITITTSGLPPAAAPAQGTARRSDGTTVAMASVGYSQQDYGNQDYGNQDYGNQGCRQPAPLHVTADSDGEFTTTYKPCRPGRYTFTATGESGRTATATGTVLPPHKPKPKPPHGGGHLPVTGASMSTPMKLGGGLAGAGALLVLLSLAWRRRGRFGMGSR